MRKGMLMLLTGIIATYLLACSVSESEDVLAVADVAEVSAIETTLESTGHNPAVMPDGAFTAEDETLRTTASDTGDSKDSSLIQWSFVTHTRDDEISKHLREEKYATFLVDDLSYTVDIRYQVNEGAVTIQELMISGEGIEDSFLMEDFDAEFEKMALQDTNGDGATEILLMFDTHGTGGQGTHEILIVKRDKESLNVSSFLALLDPAVYSKQVHFQSDRSMILTNFDGSTFASYQQLGTKFDFLYDTNKLYETTVCDIDGFYDFRIINYEGEEHLLLYQYVWAYEHSMGIGALVTIVDFLTIPYSGSLQQFEPYNEYRE
ncbi:MAG: hypothetical protein LBM69_08435 [Lachnospiraceae bacterium]|jgi:hypothetical protein|nr:hypothetical protein [Lachnospiraceae bacterium]